MIPSDRWFPTKFAEQAAWYQNFIEQYGNIGVDLGILPAEVITLTNDRDVMDMLANSALLLKAYMKAVREFRVYITQSDVGDPQPEWPTPPTLSMTGTPTGLFERLDRVVKRIRTSPNYTPEIGALLGILPASTARPPVNDLKPVITVTGAADDYAFTMNATRFGMTAYKVQVQRTGQTSWADIGFSQERSFTVSVTPTTPGQPERVLVRAVLMQNSQPVGVPSDPAYVTVNP